MIARRAGSIITMASVAARLPGGAPIAYAAAKAGIIVFSQQVAKEAGPSQVRVNCLCPSTVLTERMRQAIPAEQQQQMAKMYPLGRLGVPDDVANASLFLASDASSWITGVTLDIRRTGHGVTLGEAQSPSSARLLKGKSLRFRAASTRSTEPARRAHLVAAGCDRPPSTVVGCRDGERR